MYHDPDERGPAVLLDDWRTLTEAESGAIASGDWSGLLAVQSGKAALRGAWLEAEARGVRFPRAAIEGLIALEHRNAEALAVRRRLAEEDRAALERSRRDLRRLQSHFHVPAASGWHSYS